MKPRNVYVCHVCEYQTIYWARIERHMDIEHGGGRIRNEVSALHSKG